MDDRTFLVASGVWEVQAHDEIDACAKFLDILEADISRIDVVEVVEGEEDDEHSERQELPDGSAAGEDDDGVVVQFGPVTGDVLNRPDPKDDN